MSTKRFSPEGFSRISLLLTLALLGGAIALVPSLRYRAGLWASAVGGGDGAPSLREAAVQTAPYRYQAGLRRQLGPDVPQIARQLTMPDPPDPSAEWPLSKYILISQTVWSAEHLNIHYSRLEGLAHQIHEHDEEEMLVPISGEVEILGSQATERTGPGVALYYAAREPHSIRALGPGPATYVAWRWKGAGTDAAGKLQGRLLDLHTLRAEGKQAAEAGESVKTPLFEGETQYLKSLYAHLRTLPPGDGIEPHEDDHDAVLILFEGTIQTQGETLTAPAISFNPAFSEHGVHNPGPGIAQYLAVDMTPR